MDSTKSEGGIGMFKSVLLFLMWFHKFLTISIAFSIENRGHLPPPKPSSNIALLLAHHLMQVNRPQGVSGMVGQVANGVEGSGTPLGCGTGDRFLSK